MKRYVVDLTDAERAELHALCGRGQSAARKLNRTRILLLADDGKKDAEIADVLHVGQSTVERTRKRFVEGGLPLALNELPRPGGKRALDGEGEAYLVALACSDPPDGRREWTMQLLADRLVALGVVETISDETVRVTLKKGNQAVGKAAVVHPGSGGGVRVAHGGGTRSVCRGVRPATPSGVLR